MVSEGSCFPLQVSVLQYNLRQMPLLIRPMKGWSHDTILQKRCMMKNNDIP